MSPERITELVSQVGALSDPEARSLALELVQQVMELHGAGLARLMELVSEAEAGAPVMDALAEDEVVSGMLLLHDLHPLDIETRVRRALEDPGFHARGARVELVSCEDSVVRVQVEGGPALRAAVEQALTGAAPDAVEIVVDSSDGNAFIPLERLLAT